MSQWLLPICQADECAEVCLINWVMGGSYCSLGSKCSQFAATWKQLKPFIESMMGNRVMWTSFAADLKVLPIGRCFVASHQWLWQAILCVCLSISVSKSSQCLGRRLPMKIQVVMLWIICMYFSPRNQYWSHFLQGCHLLSPELWNWDSNHLWSLNSLLQGAGVTAPLSF